MDEGISVFGEEVLLWVCAVRQSPRRPSAEHVHRQANLLLDELKASPVAAALPVQAVDDGLFAIAALIDELAMARPEFRPVWARVPLQSTRWTTNNAGVEVFQRLEGLRRGPKAVLATYAAVLGMGFTGRFGLPGADREELARLRRDLALALGVDANRDWETGVLKSSRPGGPSAVVPREPWYRSVRFGLALALLSLSLGLGALALVFVWKRI